MAMEQRIYRTVALAAGALMCVGVPAHVARSQDVKLADLEATTVTAEITLDQLIERDGMKSSVKTQQVWKISVGANKAIDFTMDSTARGPGGTRKAKQLVASVDLDESRVVGTRGGGEALWTFADGALTFVRTLPSGAYRMNIAFAHAAAGPTCAVTGAFARENGRGPIQLISPFSGDRVTILSAKQVASSCKVSRNAAAGAAQ
jgi:hypothetical protein